MPINEMAFGVPPTKVDNEMAFSTPKKKLLLDAFPNAAAAYSLRKLRSAYNGSAIRVRRSSDNTEKDIGFTNESVLDEVSLTRFVGGGNGFVTRWYDQTSNARNLLQTTGTAQGRIVNSGTVESTNGKPAILFSQSGQQRMTASASSLSNPFTWIQVSYLTADNASGYRIFGGIGSNAMGAGYDNSGNIYLATSTSISLSKSRPTRNEVFFSIINGIYSSFTVNYSSATTGSIANFSASNINLGFNGAFASTASSGFHQEVILYSSNMESNRSLILYDINTFYSIN